MALFQLREGFRVETTASGGRVVHVRTGDALALTPVEIQLLARATTEGIDPQDPALRPVIRKLAGLGVLMPARGANGEEPVAIKDPAPAKDGGAKSEKKTEPGGGEMQAESAASQSTAVIAPKPDDVVPLFRRDLKLVRKPEGGLYDITDPETGRSFTLYDFELSLGRMLNGQRRYSEVVEAGQRLGIPVNLESLAQFVRQLERYNFFSAKADAPLEPCEGTTWPPREEWEAGIRTIFQSGLRMSRQGRYSEAASYFEAILQQDPDNPEAIEMLSQVRQRLSTMDWGQLVPQAAPLPNLPDQPAGMPFQFDDEPTLVDRTMPVPSLDSSNWLDQAASPAPLTSAAGSGPALASGAAPVTPLGRMPTSPLPGRSQTSPPPAQAGGAAAPLGRTQTSPPPAQAGGAAAPLGRTQTSPPAAQAAGAAAPLGRTQTSPPAAQAGAASPLGRTQTSPPAAQAGTAAPLGRTQTSSSAVQAAGAAATPDRTQAAPHPTGEAVSGAPAGRSPTSSPITVGGAAAGAPLGRTPTASPGSGTPAAAPLGRTGTLIPSFVPGNIAAAPVPGNLAAAPLGRTGTLIPSFVPGVVPPSAAAAKAAASTAAPAGPAATPHAAPASAPATGSGAATPSAAAVSPASSASRSPAQAPGAALSQTSPTAALDAPPWVVVSPLKATSAAGTAKAAGSEDGGFSIEDVPMEEPATGSDAEATIAHASSAPVAGPPQATPVVKPAPAVPARSASTVAAAPSAPSAPAPSAAGSLDADALFASEATEPTIPNAAAPLAGAKKGAAAAAPAVPAGATPAAVAAPVPSVASAAPTAGASVQASSSPSTSAPAKRKIGLVAAAAAALVVVAAGGAWFALSGNEPAGGAPVAAKPPQKPVDTTGTAASPAPGEAAGAGASAQAAAPASAAVAPGAADAPAANAGAAAAAASEGGAGAPASAQPASGSAGAEGGAAAAAGAVAQAPEAPSAPGVAGAAEGSASAAAANAAAAPAAEPAKAAAAPTAQAGAAEPAKAADAPAAAAVDAAAGSWTEAVITRRGRVTMGEVKATAAGPVEWLAQPQQRVRKGDMLGTLQAPAGVVPLVAPKAGLFVPKVADKSAAVAGATLAAVVYHEAFIQATVSGPAPQPGWRCQVFDAASGQTAECKVVTVAAKAGGTAVTSTAEPTWIDTAEGAKIRFAP